MSLKAPAIAIIVFCAYPAALWAQGGFDPTLTSRPGGVSPVVYQRLDAEQANGNSGAGPKLLPPDPVRSVDTSAPLPLKPRAAAMTGEDGKRPGGYQSLVTVGSSLAVVLGVFVLIVWLMRRASPNGLAALPPETFELLGRGSLGNRQYVHLLRCGNKVLLVSIAANGAGVSTLTEISDQDEVERLVSLCRHRSIGAGEREDRNA